MCQSPLGAQQCPVEGMQGQKQGFWSGVETGLQPCLGVRSLLFLLFPWSICTMHIDHSLHKALELCTILKFLFALLSSPFIPSSLPMYRVWVPFFSFHLFSFLQTSSPFPVLFSLLPGIRAPPCSSLTGAAVNFSPQRKDPMAHLVFDLLH